MYQSDWQFMDISSGIPAIQWLSDNELIYIWNESFITEMSLHQLDPFTGDVTVYNGEPFYLPLPILSYLYGGVTYNNSQTAYIGNSASNNYTNLYDAEDNLISTIAAGRNDYVDWQDSDQQFALINEDTLLIGSVEGERLIDTCLNINTVAWSPSGELAVSDGEWISIINFEEGTHFIAAHHKGSVFDWRVPLEED
jgi:hypothetical protein